MDHDPDLVPVHTRSDGRRTPSILAASIAVFLLIALVKPWSFGASPQPDAPATGVPAATAALAAGPTPSPAATPSPTPAIVDPNAMACLTDESDQIVLLERWSGNEVRSWVAAVDMIVADPLDDRLQPVTVFSTHVIGLGVCAPRSSGEAVPAAQILDVRAIVADAGGRRSVDLGEPERISLESHDPEPAVLFGAPAATRPSPTPGLRRLDSNFDPHDPGRASAPPTRSGGPVLAVADFAIWPTGSYAIGFRFGSDATTVVRWLRIDLLKGAGAAG